MSILRSASLSLQAKITFWVEILWTQRTHWAYTLHTSRDWTKKNKDLTRDFPADLGAM